MTAGQMSPPTADEINHLEKEMPKENVWAHGLFTEVTALKERPIS
jgi:hypothetical protein